MAAKNRFNPIDCLDAALPDEEYFVLLARDPIAPWILAIWASLRVGNVAAMLENTRLMGQELREHYTKHPDTAKSEEAVNTAQRMIEWRERNLDGPDGKPTWKKSLVRPRMFQPLPEAVRPGPAQVVCQVCQELDCECDPEMEQWERDLSEEARETLDLLRRVRREVGMKPIRAYFKEQKVDDSQELLSHADRLPAVNEWAQKRLEEAYNLDADDEDI